MQKKTLPYIWEKSVNVALALYYSYFAYIHLSAFVTTYRFSSLLLVVFEALIIFCLLFRSLPKDVSFSLYDWSIALGGTLAPLLLRPAPIMHDHIIWQIIQAGGIFISCIGLLSLNKSWGIVAANRGIKTTGLFGHVRHPVYAGYFISLTGFVLQNITLLNAIMWLFFAMFSLLRMQAEEKFLSKDPAYAAYMKSVKWRILPRIW